MSLSNMSRARQAHLVLAVAAIVCTIVVGVLESNRIDEKNQREKRDQYEQCLSEERARLAELDTSLEAEDFCHIYPDP